MARSRHIPTFPLRRLLLAAILALTSVEVSAAGCPAEPAELLQARFALSGNGQPPGPDAAFSDVHLPDQWRKRLPDAGGLAWYRLPIGVAAGGDPHCAFDVLLYAYAHHFGRLGPVWVGPHATLHERYARAMFRQIRLAEIGTALALDVPVWSPTVSQTIWGWTTLTGIRLFEGPSEVQTETPPDPPSP